MHAYTLLQDGVLFRDAYLWPQPFGCYQRLSRFSFRCYLEGWHAPLVLRKRMFVR